ncbi:MAG TPA: hypothetical protein PKI11_11655 [Candidatus Hydrogenedentes bacterium]|nr:hypothetical protein [Candidatus Hydrogenedentota bacterium]
MRPCVIVALMLLLATASLFASEAAPESRPQATAGDVVQAQVVLTVSESKRLIAKAVARMPVVERALRDGVVIVAKGTTNTYVAEELAGEPVPRGAFVYGRTYPAKGGKALPEVEAVSEVIFVNGERRRDLSLDEALDKLEPGDVVIKGANALDYQNKTAGVLTGSPTGGTSGKVLPYVVARKAHLIIPVGLEKQTAFPVMDIAARMREPVESLNDIPSMFLLTGEIFTEIEALRLLAGVSVFQAASGGIGGAEGAVRLVLRGTRNQVEAALRLVEGIQGEPPFVE